MSPADSLYCPYIPSSDIFRFQLCSHLRGCQLSWMHKPYPPGVFESSFREVTRSLRKGDSFLHTQLAAPGGAFLESSLSHCEQSNRSHLHGKDCPDGSLMLLARNVSRAQMRLKYGLNISMLLVALWCPDPIIQTYSSAHRNRPLT